MESFRDTPKAVLLGTRSFWEGVDVPGDPLSCLVLAKLPFAVPSDPVFVARSEEMDDPFYQYAMPDAILRFRQGFGRLIRTKTDRGVAVVMDSRVLQQALWRAVSRIAACLHHDPGAAGRFARGGGGVVGAGGVVDASRIAPRRRRWMTGSSSTFRLTICRVARGRMGMRPPRKLSQGRSMSG